MSIERFSFVLRTSWAWAGSTIRQAPKERQFIACGRQPQDPETHQEKFYPAPAGRQPRAVAEPSCRPDWGSERGRGKGRLGTSWGLRPQAMNFRRYAAGENGMVQILGDSGNSTDRPHASTVGIRSVVGPIAGSGTLEAVPAQPVEPVRVRLASQELSGEFSHSLQALAPLQRPVMEAECGPDQGS